MQVKSTPTKRLVYGACALAAISVAVWGAMSLHAKEASTPEAPVSIQHEGTHVIVPEKSPLRRSLAIAPAVEGTVAAPFVLPASVEADPAKLVKVLPPLTGRIVSLNKQLGDEVKAGDVLFSIDSADLAQATSDAAKAKATLELTKHNLERLRELDKSEIAAKRDLEQAQNDYSQAVSEADRANNRLAQLGAKGGGQVTGGHILAVRSPISGRVVDLTAAIGGYWNDATAPIMTVADLSRVYVTANAQEKDLSQVYAGQSATIKLDAYTEALPAKVRYVGELLDPDTRTVKVRMMFDNRDGRLKPGMFGQATFLGRPHTGITVPMTAVLQSGFYSRTFVEVAPWQFEARVVKVGAQLDDHVEIVSGLKSGERVVIKEGVLLND